MKRLAFALVLSLVACPAMMKVDNPESRDYPCGPSGVVCSGEYPHAVCCWHGDVCGTEPSAGFSTCPPSMCCFVGDDTSLGVHKPYPQVRK